MAVAVDGEGGMRFGKAPGAWPVLGHFWALRQRPLEFLDSLPGTAGGAGHRASYLPFGAGATKCVGEEFGVAEATLVVASIAARRRLSPRSGGRVTPSARVVLTPKAFPVRLSAR